MQRFVVVLLLAGLGWYGYGKYQANLAAPEVAVESESEASPTPLASSTAAFACDGRTYCSQMTSCAEATYFLKSCPDTKMDGNNDGIPCEKQWCK